MSGQKQHLAKKLIHMLEVPPCLTEIRRVKIIPIEKQLRALPEERSLHLRAIYTCHFQRAYAWNLSFFCLSFCGSWVRNYFYELFELALNRMPNEWIIIYSENVNNWWLCREQSVDRRAPNSYFAPLFLRDAFKNRRYQLTCCLPYPLHVFCIFTLATAT